MTPTIAVLDYGIGNLRSAQKALERVGAQASLTDDPELIGRADAVVLPGVGNFGRCMDSLRETGLDVLALQAIESDRPFLGICVGMQMLFEGSDESPQTKGLGVFPGMCTLLPDSVKRPQMQWNHIEVRNDRTLLDGLNGEWMYFVHSYAAPVDAFCSASTTYGTDMAAVVSKDNVDATQFHPEKSGAAGLRLLSNFVRAVQARTDAGQEPV